MRLTQDNAPGRNVIRGYAAGELRVNELVFRHAILIDAQAIRDGSEFAEIAVGDEQLARRLEASLLALQPEIILFGSGPRQVFPPAAFGARFLRAGIGFEVMDTGAASRTFNVLVAEQRRVAAVLLV